LSRRGYLRERPIAQKPLLLVLQIVIKFRRKHCRMNLSQSSLSACHFRFHQRPARGPSTPEQSSHVPFPSHQDSSYSTESPHSLRGNTCTASPEQPLCRTTPQRHTQTRHSPTPSPTFQRPNRRPLECRILKKCPLHLLSRGGRKIRQSVTTSGPSRFQFTRESLLPAALSLEATCGFHLSALSRKTFSNPPPLLQAFQGAQPVEHPDQRPWSGTLVIEGNNVTLQLPSTYAIFGSCVPQCVSFDGVRLYNNFPFVDTTLQQPWSRGWPICVPRSGSSFRLPVASHWRTVHICTITHPPPLHYESISLPTISATKLQLGVRGVISTLDINRHRLAISSNPTITDSPTPSPI